LYFILCSPHPRGKQAADAPRRSVNRGVEIGIRLSCSDLSERSDIRSDAAARGDAVIGALELRNGHNHVTRPIAEPA